MCRHMYNWNIVECDVIQPKMNLNQKFTSLAKIRFKYIEFVENAQNEESAIYFKGNKFGEDVKQEAQRATYRAPEYNVPPLWEIGQGGYFCLLIGPKNTNFEEDIEILLPVKFHWIPFSGFRGEVKNVSANQRPGRQSCIFDRPEKYKLGSRRLDFAFVISFVEFRSAVSEKSKMSQPIRG